MRHTAVHALALAAESINNSTTCLVRILLFFMRRQSHSMRRKDSESDALYLLSSRIFG
jgi:hypothetical protein